MAGGSGRGNGVSEAVVEGVEQGGESETDQYQEFSAGDDCMRGCSSNSSKVLVEMKVFFVPSSPFG